jgi:hypothetical protein
LKILSKLSRPSLENNFLTAAERYNRLEFVPVGGSLAPLKVVNKDGGWTRIYQPKHVIDAAIIPKTFWFMTAALPPY